ncbi:MAG: glycosyltransferase [Candidatus Micrarchaeota archaeon]
MGKPKVCICIPAYNTGKFIRETIESVLAQDYENLSIIVIDNGSTDETQGIVGSFKDKRLACKRFDKTLPPCENWNRCFGLAKGDYLAIYHSDDIYEKDAASKEVEFLEKNRDCVAVFSSATLISGSGKKIGETSRPGAFSKGKADARELLAFSMRSGYFPLICPTFMVRMSAVEKCGAFDCSGYKFAFDMDYYLRLAEFGEIGFLEQKLIRYRQHPLQGSVRFNDVIDTQREFFQILEKSIGRWGMEFGEKDWKRLRAYERWGGVVDALTYVRAGNSEAALKLTKESFRPLDGLVDFPSPRFMWRAIFTFWFLVLQYLWLGKAFASLVFWYRKRKRE